MAVAANGNRGFERVAPGRQSYAMHVVHVLAFFRLARGPFMMQHLHAMSCDMKCQCGLAAACSLSQFLGHLACGSLSCLQKCSLWRVCRLQYKCGGVCMCVAERCCVLGATYYDA